MNCEAVQAVLLHSCSANAARMVLLVLAAHSNERGHVGALPISQLCAEANASERTVKYAVRELRDELKEILTEREGSGRGHTFDFDISPLLEKVQNLHASDKRADLAPIEKKGAKTTPIDPAKGADIAPLSDSKGANFTGTEVAPYSDIRTSTDKNINNHTRANVTPIFSHEVSPAVQVYRDVFGTDPPPYGQDQIERDATDLPRWRATCEQWKGNNNDRTKVWNMLDAYKKKVSDANGNGREKQAGRRDGAAKQVPRAPEAVNRDWRAKNIV